mgnify:CR=1 FL=1
MRKILLISSVVFGLISCSTTQNKHEQEFQLHGSWKVSKIGADSVPSKLMMTLNIDTAMSVNGKAACNSFFGKVVQKNDSLFFGAMGSTRMLCQPLLNQWEMKYLTGLSMPLKLVNSGNNRFTLSNDNTSLSLEKNIPTVAK